MLASSRNQSICQSLFIGLIDIVITLLICHIIHSLLRLKSFSVLFLILYLILQDPQSVREARQIEQKFIKKWIDQYHKQQPSGGHDDTVDPIIVG